MHKGDLKLIIDVGYHQNEWAKVSGGYFRDWEDHALFQLSSKIIPGPLAEYVPGQFYKRELPCILDYLSGIRLKKIGLILMDGYVYLDDQGRKGLGAWLFEALNKEIPIIGIAKSKFQVNRKTVLKVFRGSSKIPLYISAAGYALPQAAQKIRNMYGYYRIPELIKDVDRDSKEFKKEGEI